MHTVCVELHGYVDVIVDHESSAGASVMRRIIRPVRMISSRGAFFMRN